jgi:hypothetical protein
MSWETASADTIKAAEATIPFVMTLIRRLPSLLGAALNG